MIKRIYRCPHCNRGNAAGSVVGYLICKLCGKPFLVGRVHGDEEILMSLEVDGCRG